MCTPEFARADRACARLESDPPRVASARRAEHPATSRPDGVHWKSPLPAVAPAMCIAKCALAEKQREKNAPR